MRSSSALKGASTPAGIALVVAAVLFCVFLANVLLAFGKLHLGLEVAPLFGRVLEFLMLLGASLAFGLSALLTERQTSNHQTTRGEP